MRRRTALPATLAVAAVAALCGAPAAIGNAPFATGSSAANVPLDSAGKQVLIRWVARQSGALAKLHIRIKVEGSAACPQGGRSGYGAGTTGVLAATTHPILPDGRPDARVTLASQSFNPCSVHRDETVALDMGGLAVARGAEYGTVVRNADGSPGSNWFSLNFLHQSTGTVGANGRNERSASAADTYYGLDPRELVGYSTNGGSSWSLPGGPYGPGGGKAFLPSYVQEYADGARLGQPYYYSSAVSGDVAMDYRPREDWTITQLGAYSAGSGSSTVRLLVDGSERASAALAGNGFLTADIAPVVAPAGSTVRITATSGGSGLQLRMQRADALWTSLLDLARTDWFSNGDRGNRTNPIGLFPLPAPGAGFVAGTPAAASASVPAPAAPAAAAAPTTLAAPVLPPRGRSRARVPQVPVDGGVARVGVRCAGPRACTKRITVVVGRQVRTVRLRVAARSTRVARVRLNHVVRRVMRRHARVPAALRIGDAVVVVMLVRTA